MAYTQFGAFSDDSPPALDDSFFNAIEAFLLTINSAATDGNVSSSSGILAQKALSPSPTVVSITGTTAGTADLYQFMRGTIKAFILIFNGYRNASGTEQTIGLPTAFTTRCNFLSGNGKQVTPYSGGSALVNKVNLNNNGTPTNGSTVNAAHHGEIIQGFDALGLGISQATTASAIYFFIGI